MRITKAYTAILIATICVVPLWNVSGAGAWSLDGYYKNYSTAINQPDIENPFVQIDQPLMGAVSNRLRLQVRGRLYEWLTVDAAYDIAPRIQDEYLYQTDSLAFGVDQSAYRAFDLRSRLYPSKDERPKSFAVYNNIDRAYLSARANFADFYLGRQPIAWGSARVINPTDVLAPYAFDELDVEDRIGADAVRMRVPLGFMGEFDAGYVFGDDFEFDKSAFFLRGKFYYHKNDITAMLVGFRENLLLGFDLARPVGGAGFWLEGGYVLAGALNSGERDSDNDYFRLSIGSDYSLRDGTYLFLEYHYNQAGTSNPAEYASLADRTAYRNGAVYLLGEHYLIPGISYQITPLVILTGEVMLNLNDPSAFVISQVDYNIAEDFYLSAGAHIGLGDGPTVSDDIFRFPLLILESEFGSYPDSYFASFRIYF